MDRQAFPRRIARPVTTSDLAAGDAKVRVPGDPAIVHARTSQTSAEGERRHGRYTDVWARRAGEWLAGFTHVKR